jgi:drug/metabolite transporter (DMT)-like permease
VPALLAASLLWAFSFGLIKGQLAGVSPLAVAAGRVALAALILLPVAGRRVAAPRARLEAAALGAIQFGLMYVLYVAAFRWLAAWVVALLTVFTPLYVLLFARLASGRARGVAAAVLAVGGAALLSARGAPAAVGWPGVLLLQGSNLCFAWGQVRFGALRQRWAAPDLGLVAWMYAGAAVATAAALALAAAFGHDPAAGWTRRSLLVLLYLGALPTAAGFYLWNRGAARTAPALLAVANNLKVPLAVLVSWFVFGEARPAGAALGGLGLLLVALVVAGDPLARRRA